MIELRPYQATALSRARDILRQHNIVYLALETRLGKTHISLALANETGLPVLFVTKKKAIPSITNDYNAAGYTYPLEVTNYEQLKNQTYSKRVIIIDEAHGCGAYPKPCLRAKQLRALTKDCPVILLSGTPTPEGLSSIYHQLWCANAHLAFIYQYENFYKWARVYVQMQEVNGKMAFRQKCIGTGQWVNDYSPAKTELIDAELDKIRISMTQDEAGFAFDSLNESFINCPTPDWIKDIWKALKNDGLATVKGKTFIADTAVSRMNKMHQLCGGTIIDDQDNGIPLSAFKLPAIQRLYDEFGKIAVYYKFKAEYELLSTAFAGLVYADWQEFQAADSGIFIGQFQSAKEGINLSTAKAMVFYNIDYAFVSYEQSKNRIQKIDREEQGKLFYLCSDLGMEKAILKRVLAKKNFTSIHFRRLDK